MHDAWQFREAPKIRRANSEKVQAAVLECGVQEMNHATTAQTCH